MKKTRCLTTAILVFFLALWMESSLSIAEDRYSNWTERDLISTGKAISNGLILTDTIKFIEPPQILPSLKTMENFSIDMTKINVGALQANAVGKMGEKVLITEYRLASYGRWYGHVVPVYQFAIFNKQMFDCWKVGTGRADPTLLRPIIPHVVQAWEVIRGPENLPTHVFSTPVNRTYNDGAWRIQQQDWKITQQTSSSAAPGKIGRYGYDPYTDSLIKTTQSYSRITTQFDGAAFNRWYDQNKHLLNIRPQIYNPQIYNPPKIYTPQIYNPPKIYIPPPPVYNPPPKIYTPPRR